MTELEQAEEHLRQAFTLIRTIRLAADGSDHALREAERLAAESRAHIGAYACRVERESVSG